MNWKFTVIEELEAHQRKIHSLENIKNKIRTLELRKTDLKGQQYDKEPVTGTGANHYEDGIIDAMVEIERLKRCYRMNKSDVNRVGEALKALDTQEYKIIENFYMSGRKPNIPKLEKEIKYQKSQIYRIRDKALKKLTYELYGREEA